MTGGAIAILTFTFHPDWYVGATVVPPRTLGGQEVAGRGVEPVPVLGQLRVTDGLARAHTQVVVEAPLRLTRDHLMVKMFWENFSFPPGGCLPSKGRLQRPP